MASPLKRMKNRMRSLIILTVVYSFIHCSAKMAIAADYTWNTTSNTWNTAANWIGGLPVSNLATNLIFGGSTQYTVTDNIGTGAFVFNSITFNNSYSGTGSGVTLAPAAGQTLTIGVGTSPGIIQNGSASASIMMAVTIANTQTVTPAISITSTGGLSLLSLNTVSGKQLTFSGNYNGSGTNANNQNTFSGTGATFITGGIIQNANGATVVKSGTGTLTLNGAGDYNGATTISAGVVNIRNATSLGSTAAGTSVTANGAALQIQGGITVGNEALSLIGTGVSNDGALRNISDTNDYGGLITLAGAARINSDSGLLKLSNVGTIIGATFGLTVGGAGDTQIDSNIGTTTGTLNKDGLGTLTLTADSTYSGLTTISQGTLQIGNGGTTGSIVSDVSNSGTLIFNRSDNVIFSGNISGNGTITHAAGSILTLTGTNTASTVNITSGTLQIGSGGTTGSITGNVNNSGTLTFNRSDNVVFSGNITGGIVNQAGGGAITLSGTNTPTMINVNSGSLRVQPGATSTATDVIVASGAGFSTFNPGANAVDVKTLTFSAGATTLGIDFVGTPALSGSTSTGYVPFINVAQSDGFVSNASTTINITNNGGALNGTFTLVKYLGTDPTPANFTFGTQPPRASVTPIFDTVNKEINITIAQLAIKWTGTDGTNPTFWDIGTIDVNGNALTGSVNWQQVGGGNPATAYTQVNPSPGDTVIFDGTASSFTVALQTNLAPSSITVSGGNYTFNGSGNLSGPAALNIDGATTFLLLNNTATNTFTSGTNITNGATLQVGDGTNSSNLPGNASFTNGGTLKFNPGSTVTFDGSIIGTGAIQVNSSTVIFTNVGNTYTGGTTIDLGATLQIGDGTSSGSLPTTSITNNGTLAFNPEAVGYTFTATLTSGAVSILGSNTTTFTGTNTYAGGTTIASGAKLQIGNGSTGALPGNVISSGTLAFNLGSSYTYGGNVTGGAIQILSNTVILTGTNALTLASSVSSGATLQLGDGTTPGSFTGSNIVNAGTVIFNPGPTSISFGSAISTTGGVNILSGTVTLSVASTYTGPTNISNGATLTAGIAQSVAAASSTTLAAGATLDLNGFSHNFNSLNAAAGSFILLGNNTSTLLTFNGGGTVTIDGIISGSGGISKTGAGTVILSAQNSYTGDTNVQNANAVIRLAGSNPNVLPITTHLLNGNNNNATLDLNGISQEVAGFGGSTASPRVINPNTAPAAVFTLNIASGSNTSQWLLGAAASSGNFSLVKKGAGELILAKANLFTGTTTISNGTLTAGIANALSTSTAVTVTTGTTFNLANFSQSIGPLAGDGSVTLGTNAATTLTINGGVTTFSGVISGTGNLSRLNASNLADQVLTLASQQSYIGNTNIQGTGAAIRIDVNDALPTTTTLTFNGTTNGAGITPELYFDLNGKNQTIAALTSATTTGRVFIENNSGAGTSVLTITNGTGTFSGAVTTGTSSIRDNNGVATGGIVAVSFTGGTTTFFRPQAYTGATSISNATLILSSNAVDAVASSGQGELAVGSTVTINDGGELAGVSTISPDTLVVRVGTVNGPVSLTGGITGTKLSGTGTPTPNLVLAGTLSVSGANNSVTTGNVSVAGTTTINSGGTFSVNSLATLSGVGTIVVDGSLVVDGTVNKDLTVNDAGSVAGIGTISGAVNLGGGVTGTTIASTGTLTLGGTFGVSGENNSIASGEVSVAGLTSISSSGALLVDIGTTFSGAGNVDVSGLLTAKGIVNKTVTVNDGGSLAGEGSVSGAVSLGSGATGTTIFSTGTLTLGSTLGVSGTNNHITTGTVSVAGLTTINRGGTLVVNSSATLNGAGSVDVTGTLINNSNTFGKTVNLLAGGTLRGIGTYGDVSVPNNATLSPGNSIGTLTVASASYASGATFEVELGSANPGPYTGNTNDLLIVIGTFNFDTGSIVRIESLTTFTTPGTFEYRVGAANTYLLDSNSLGGDPFTFGSFTVGGSNTGPVILDVGDFAIVGDSFLLQSSGNDLILTYNTAAPEPSANLLISSLAGLVFLGVRKRWRSRTARIAPA
ncbi:MAG: autotransporter-associated beta strand repeat-containing protein [Planctomycetes bacterium]|nr:autotransporter-associated beta strand repeat-containing protein [Planctomycetota bacterium]